MLRAQRWDPVFASTAPVGLDEARAARDRFALSGDQHPVPHCFSCGLQPDSMRVHAGPLGDGRFATDWRVPEWAVDDTGTVDPAALWAAIDCTAAWYACCAGGIRPAVTVQFAAEVHAPLMPGEQYALLGWAGDGDPHWTGRKRTAASAAFAADGTCVARSRSLWVAAPDPPDA